MNGDVMLKLKRPADLPKAIVSANAETVLARRYYIKDENGKPTETATDLFWRVAATIAAEEAKYDKSPYKPEDLAREFYDLMAQGKFLPNSPTLMNAGKTGGQLAACFVLPVGDSMEEIFDAVKNAALIHKSGGGTGFSFSRLRPKDARVGSTGGVASGPVSFMRIFNTATEQVKQGGTRRGANMGILRVDHPDILEFIDCKKQDGELTNFNISVAVTDDFMQAVEDDETYDLVDPKSKSCVGDLDAREVFGKLVYGAWKTADPGIIYLDTVNKANPTPALGEIEATNPCAEQPLLPYEACNLGSINVAKYFDMNPTSGKHRVNWENLRADVRLATRFLDNVIDASAYPLPEITEMVHSTRKIGLGVMGFADLLYLIGVPYDSAQALDLAGRVMSVVQSESRKESQRLAAERGPCPAFKDSTPDGGFLQRNAATTTIAPTGTLSIIAGCSSGIEPLFALAFARHVMDGDKLVEVNSVFEQAVYAEGIDYQEFQDDILRTGSVQRLDSIPEHIRRVFVTAMDIAPLDHLKMQAAFQKFNDSAVSKTVNLPASATEDDIREIYMQAWKLGCKGVTVYRDGCKADQVLRTGNSAPKPEEAPAPATPQPVRTRPEIVQGFTQKVKTGLGALYLTINEIDGKPFEVFATIGKSGHSVTAKAEAIGRLVSLCLRAGVEVDSVVAQLKGIGGENPVFRNKGMLLSIPDAVAWVLESRYLCDCRVKEHVAALGRAVCPECGADLVFEEGCNVCKSCGFSRCAG